MEWDMSHSRQARTFEQARDFSKWRHLAPFGVFVLRASTEVPGCRIRRPTCFSTPDTRKSLDGCRQGHRTGILGQTHLRDSGSKERDHGIFEDGAHP